MSDLGPGDAAAASERNRTFVRITFTNEGTVGSLPEVIRALQAVDQIWALAGTEQRVRRWLAFAGEALQEAPRQMEIGSIRSQEKRPRYPLLRTVGRLESALEELRDPQSRYNAKTDEPELLLSKQSPLWVELAQAGAVTGVSLAVWRTFVYIVNNAERIGSTLPRLRTGWDLGRAESEDAATLRQAAQVRRLLGKIELERVKQLSDLSETLERLGPLTVESNVVPLPLNGMAERDALREEPAPRAAAEGEEG